MNQPYASCYRRLHGTHCSEGRLKMGRSYYALLEDSLGGKW
jgi:hypothetical protein